MNVTSLYDTRTQSFMICLHTQTLQISDYQRQKKKQTNSPFPSPAAVSNISVTQLLFKYVWGYKYCKLKLLVYKIMHATRGQSQVEGFRFHQHYLSLKRVWKGLKWGCGTTLWTYFVPTTPKTWSRETPANHFFLRKKYLTSLIDLIRMA